MNDKFLYHYLNLYLVGGPVDEEGRSRWVPKTARK